MRPSVLKPLAHREQTNHGDKVTEWGIGDGQSAAGRAPSSQHASTHCHPPFGLAQCIRDSRLRRILKKICAFSTEGGTLAKDQPLARPQAD